MATKLKAQSKMYLKFFSKFGDFFQKKWEYCDRIFPFFNFIFLGIFLFSYFSNISPCKNINLPKILLNRNQNPSRYYNKSQVSTQAKKNIIMIFWWFWAAYQGVERSSTIRLMRIGHKTFKVSTPTWSKMVAISNPPRTILSL